MTGPDPVLFPDLVPGVVAERQRAERARAALRETVTALGERTTAKAAARRGMDMVTVPRSLPGALLAALAAGALAGAVAAVIAGRVVDRGRTRAAAGAAAAGLAATVLAATRARRGATGRSTIPGRPVLRETGGRVPRTADEVRPARARRG